MSFLISVRNNKSQAADVKLRDQIPLSQNSDITVEATELTGGILNRVTGEIVWDFQGRATRRPGRLYSPTLLNIPRTRR